MGLSPSRRLWLRGAAALAAALLTAYFANLVFEVGFGLADPHRVFSLWVYNGLIIASGVGCLLRAAAVRPERAAWLVVGGALLAWGAADVYYGLVLSDLEAPPYPSLADIGYLGLYVGLYVGLALLIKERFSNLPRSLWLDGAIAALAVASLASAVVLPKILDTATGSSAAVATTLAYPLADLLLLSVIVAVFAVSGWRPGRTWLVLGAALLTLVIADAVYLLQVAEGTYSGADALDGFWPTAALLVAFAAWQGTPGRREPRIEGLRVVLVPLACSLAALFLMVWDHYEPLNGVSLGLTGATLLLVTIRMAMAFAENQRMLLASRTEATTDALTGLCNRRKLMQDLERELPGATPANPRALVLYDLDGFKQYNDTYGHPAGDALLARLGRRLGEAAAPYGSAYRLGGDEFCVLVTPGATGVEVITAATAAALSERGEGFQITSSFGTGLVPSEAGTAEEALQLADSRMYAQKDGRRTSAGRQTRDVLLSTLRERQPELHLHLHDVAELAHGVGVELELSSDELDELGRAAELHDVGKVAIPDAILNKAGPLDDSEWVFMRRHTIVGERILGSAPALRPVAKIVRSSHERWDGDGYPDELAGEDIPLGARVVAVCDAFDAMTSERPYRGSMPREQAIEELRRCAGTQFDPRVVEAFATVCERSALKPA